MDQPPVPPTEPGDLDFAPEPPKWPTPVGVLSIVFGSLSLVCGGLGSLFLFFGINWLFQMMSSQPGAPSDPPPPMPVDPFLVATALITLIFQIVLIAAGIATMKRSPTGRPLHLVYAVGFLVVLAVSNYATWQWQSAYANSPEVAQWKAENAGNQMAEGVGQAPAALSYLPGLVISVAWPVFCIIWFGPKGRSELALHIDEEDRLV